MKKIIVAIDPLKYSESVARYSVHLATQNNAHLVGIMLEDFTYHSYKVYEVIGNDPESVLSREILEERDEHVRKESLEKFVKACSEAGVKYSFHHDRNLALQELIHESIFADLLIIAAKETLTHYEENIPTRFVRDLLSQVICPVLIVPDKYNPISKIVMLYDGHPSSVLAIRNFSCVLPGMNSIETEVLTVKRRGEDEYIPDNRLLKEYIRHHYPFLEFTILKGSPEEAIVSHLDKVEANTLIVLGAYGRGVVSRLLRKGIADSLMKRLNACFFITHSS